MVSPIDWNRKATRREQALFAAMFLVSLLFFAPGFFKSRLEEVGLNRARLVALQSERNALEKFIRTTPSLEGVPSRPRTKEIKLKVLAGEIDSPALDLTTLLSRITAPAFLKAAQVTSFSYQAEVKEAGFGRTDFLLETSGSFGDLVGYLERLEEFPALFFIKDLIVSSGEGGGSVVRAEISCRFFRKEKKS